MESHPLLLSSPTTSFATSSEIGSGVDIGADDVFGITSSSEFRHNKPSTAMRAFSESVRHSTHRGSAFTEPCDQHCVGPFELDAVDVASNSSNESGTLFVSSHSELARETQRSGENIAFSDHQAFDTIQPYAGSSDNISILESDSCGSDSEGRLQYSYAPMPRRQRPIAIAPVPTQSERRTASQTRDKGHSPNLVAKVPNFYRPLPLRSCESAARLQQKTYVQDSPGQNRASSMVDTMLGCSPASPAVTSMRMTEAVPTPPRSPATATKTAESPFQKLTIPSRKFVRNSGKILGPHDRIPLPPSFAATSPHRTNSPFPRPKKQSSESVQVIQSPPLFSATAVQPVQLARERTFLLSQRYGRDSKGLTETREPTLPLSASSATPSRTNLGSRRATSLHRLTTDDKTPRPCRSFLDDNGDTIILPRDDDQASMEDQISSAVSDDVEEDGTESLSGRHSVASTIAAFPIPPMENRVGELAMTVSRAVSPREFSETSNSIREAYRAATKAHITELLQRTRSRGAHVQTVEWNNLTAFEKTWREVNEQLLVSIYGKRDVSLTEADAEYVDAIARGIREGEGSGSLNEWLRGTFGHDV